MVVKSLNLEKALELYSIIGKYLPENPEIDTEILDFVGTIVKNIRESNPMDYLDAVMLMTGFDKQVILQSESIEVLDVFTQGLIDNRILELREFVESIEDHG